MQSFGLVLFPVILAFARAADPWDPTILETLFDFHDNNSNGAWEIEEVEGIFGMYTPDAFGDSLFHQLDTNEDLKITPEEYKKFCAEILEGIFKLNDPNGDGLITSVELLSGDAPTQPNSGLLALLFNFLDLNKDEFLSTEDVFPPEDPSRNHPNYQIVALLDDNNDGVIGLQEYLPEAPEQLVKLYNSIDKNTDDKFTLDEIEDFLTTCAAIMDVNSDGIITLEEQLNAFTQAGLTQAQAELGIAKFQRYRSSDMVNNIINILDMDNDEQVSQAEVTGILDYTVNSSKMMDLVFLAMQVTQPNVLQLDPGSAFSGQQALEALGRFLDNPRFN